MLGLSLVQNVTRFERCALCSTNSCGVCRWSVREVSHRETTLGTAATAVDLPFAVYVACSFGTDCLCPALQSHFKLS